MFYLCSVHMGSCLVRNIGQFTEDGSFKCILEEVLEHVLVAFVGKRSYSITLLRTTVN